MRLRLGVVPLATAIALGSAVARAQAPAPGDAPAPAPAPAAQTPAAAPASPADAGAKGEADLAATRKAVQDLEAQVADLRRIIDAMERSRASVEDLRRRVDEMETQLGENDRRDDALAAGADREAALFKFRDDGFAMRSPQGRFLLVPHLRVQTVYLGVIAAQGVADTAPPDQSGFSVAHAEVILEGHAGSRVLGYRLQLDAAESPSLKDAYALVSVFRSLGIRAGQFKVPFGLQRWTYSGELEFVTISAPMQAFQLGRDIGLMAVGKPLAGRLAYELALMNGAGQGLPQDNIDLAYAARVVASPWGALPPGEGDMAWHRRPRASLGVAGYYNLVPTDVRARTADPTANLDQDNDGRVDNVSVWQGGVELKAIWRGAAVQAEWFGRYETPGGIYASRSYSGGYVQASYFLIRGRLQVAGRIGSTDVPRYGATPAQRALFGTHVDEQSAALNAYLREHRVKVQVDYTHSHAEDAATGLNAATAPTQHRVRAAIQVGF